VKPFSWSYSKLKNYRTCPKRHYHVDLAKDFKEDESEHLIWGNKVHKSLADSIGKGSKLPEEMLGYAQWVERIAALRDMGFTVKVEQKLAMTEDFKPASFFSNDAWFRGVADVLAVRDPIAVSFDWKTGRIVEDIEQLALSASLVFAHYPKVDQLGATYIWLADDAETVETYTRDGMLPTWNAVLPQVKLMRDAAKDMNYPPKPSGLCKRYCPVTSCPHHGRGSY
jgi:hypothetical protein